MLTHWVVIYESLWLGVSIEAYTKVLSSKPDSARVTVMNDLDPRFPSGDAAPHAIVIGAGLGGLASAMRLGAKGYRVTVLDKLDRVGGRGSSITKGGHRFDLGPTIVTVPQVYKDLWTACGRKFEDDVELVPLDPFYEVRWPDGSRFRAMQDTAEMEAEVARLSPGDVKGYRRFLKDAERRYVVGFEGMVAKADAPHLGNHKGVAAVRSASCRPIHSGPCEGAVQGCATTHGYVVPPALYRW
jgi:phytoene desaturase